MVKCECPVCGSNAAKNHIAERFAKLYQCERCGKYAIENDADSLLTDVSEGPRLKASLFWYLLQKDNNSFQNKFLPFIISTDGEEGIRDNCQFISTKSLSIMFPRNIDDQINKILINIASIIGFIGGDMIIDLAEGKRSFPVFFVDLDYTSFNAQKQLNEKINILTENGLIKETDNLLGDNQVSYTLTAKAWKIVQDIQSQMKLLPQAFIAMWFDASMNKAKNMICQAISECGYLPMIINEKEYNSFMVPEILFEIQNSKFVVADFTGNRGGVYYEAGYAKGLGKDVIMTCKDVDFPPHFDTQQINHIIWSNEDKLYERLKKRIRSTIGCGQAQPGMKTSHNNSQNGRT